MPVIAGEPFRGLAKVQNAEAAGNRSYTLSIDDVVPDTVAADQATWEGNAGATFTLRFEWDESGVPVAGTADAGIARVHQVGGGGAQIGADLILAPVGVSGLQTFTIHFDDTPLSGALGSIRAGSFELYLQVRRNAVVAWGPVDSRGAGTPPAGAALNFARGYMRSRVLISSHSLSNVALAGAEPALWSYPDSVFSRITLNAQQYQAVSTATRLNRGGGGANERAGNTVNAAAAKDQTWTDTTGLNRRIGNGMFLGSEPKDIQLAISASAVFPGEVDNELVYAATGHQAGWVISGDFLTATEDNRITVDPRVFFTHLLLINDNTFATPPLSEDAPGHDRLASELGFAAARHRNSRMEGLNSATNPVGLTVTDRLRDVANLTAADDNAGLSTMTQGGEAGWSSLHAWSAQLPTGDWNHTMILTAPVDATGLEDPATQTASDFTLIGQDLSVRMHPQLVVGGTTLEQSHFVAGDPVKASLWTFSLTTGVRVDPALITLPRVAMFRYVPSTDRVEMLALDETTWSLWGPLDLVVFHTLTVAPMDARLFVKTFSTTLTWSRNVYGLFTVKANGVPLFGEAFLEETGAENKHTGYSLDGVQLALSGVLGTR